MIKIGIIIMKMKRILTYLILALVTLVAFSYYFINQYTYKLAEDALSDLEPKIEEWFNKHTNYKSEKIYITYDLASVNIFKNIILENIELRNINDQITLDKLSLKIDNNNINIKEAVNLDHFVSNVRFEINRFSINDLILDELLNEDPLSKLVFNDLKVEDLRFSRKEVDGSIIIEEIGIDNFGNNSLKGQQIKNISLNLPEVKLSIDKIYLDNFENIDSLITVFNNFEIYDDIYELENSHYQNAMNYYGMNVFSAENIKTKINFENNNVVDLGIGLIEFNFGRNDKKFKVVNNGFVKIDKLRIPVSIFEEAINFELYKYILDWNDELITNYFVSMDADTNTSSAKYEFNFGVEKLGSTNLNMEIGGYTDDYIINYLEDPNYTETEEFLNDITLKAFDFMYIDEGLNELVLNEINMPRQDLQFYFDEMVSYSPWLPSKYKIQLIDAFENIMAGKNKVTIQFNSRYPDGIKLTEFDYMTFDNFDRYGDFLIQVE